MRHRGTIGGSLAHADPAADLPAAVLASDAVFVRAGRGGAGRSRPTEFFLGPFTTPLEPDELLTEIRVPSQSGRAGASRSSPAAPIDWAIVGVAAVGHRVALINMGGTPVRAQPPRRPRWPVARVLPRRRRWPPRAPAHRTKPHASADYRRHLARVLTGRALAQVAGETHVGLS